MAKSDLRAVVTINGEARTLFSATETKKDSIIIAIKRVPDLALPPFLGIPIAKVLSQKYSVHPSYDSPHGVNYIHHTAVLEGRKPLQSTLVTRALRKGDVFAMLYAQRCGDLRRDAFLSKGPARSVLSLGDYDPDHFTLIYAVLASAKESVLGPVPDHLNVGSHDFKIARLTVLWTFLALPSGNSLTGHYSRQFSENPDHFDPGQAVDACVDKFGQECAKFERQHAEWLLGKMGAKGQMRYTIPVDYRKRYFKTAVVTPQTSEYLDGLGMSLRTVDVYFGPRPEQRE